MRRVLAASVLALVAACTGDAKNRPSQPDEKFGDDGVVLFDFTETRERPSDVTFDAAGRLVAAGSIAGDSQIVRLAADGTFDAGFGSAGMSPIAPAADPASVYVRPDGSIVAPVNAEGVASDFSLFTLTSEGDTGVAQTFDLGTLLGGFGSDEIFGSTMDADGRIVAFGGMGVGGGSSAVLARFTTEGSLDRSFAGGAGAIRDDETTQLEATATDGSEIIAVGSSGETMVITRYQEDGSRALSFGTGGRLTLSGGLAWKSVAIDASGRILVAGSRGFEIDDPRAYVLRRNADGSTDESFGNAGSVEFDLDPESPHSYACDVHSRADGSILVGVNSFPAESEFAGRAFLVRILEDGSMDTSFGGGTGFVGTSHLTECVGIAVDSEERAVFFGEQGGHFNSAWVLFSVAL